MKTMDPWYLCSFNATNFFYLLHTEYAYRICMNNGTWDFHKNVSQVERGHTYYDNCLIEGFKEILEMCQTIGTQQCLEVGYI